MAKILTFALLLSCAVFMLGGTAASTALAPLEVEHQDTHQFRGRRNLQKGGNGGLVSGNNERMGAPPVVDQRINPIVAIVVDTCTPSSDEMAAADFNACLDDYYVRWLASAGVRVVPIYAYWPWAKKKEVLDSVNGVLLPGGTITGQALTNYINNMTATIKYSLEEPNFLLWGTCQGMQVISIVVNNRNEDVLKCDYEGMYPSMLPLDFTAYRPFSVMFGKEAERRGIVDDLTHRKTTVNYHKCGVHTNDWRPTMTNNTHIVSTNVDVNGKLFISSFEIVGGKTKNNVFAVQYHPEKAPFKFDKEAVYRMDETLEVSFYHAMFLRKRAMLTADTHRFADSVAAEQMLIDRHTHVYTGYGEGKYWFKF